MKRLAFWFFVLLFSAWEASAQVTLELYTEQDLYLPAEKVMVQARIINRSGQTLHLGATEDWLTFNVTTQNGQNGQLALKKDDVPVVEAFDLDSSKMANKTVNLEPYFDFTRPGRYTITAMATIPGWDRRIGSDPRVIDVVPGVRLWEKEFGVPAASAQAGEPEVRKYSLVKQTSKSSMRLYLRLTDASESHIFKVFEIGPMVGFSRLEPQVDRYSNLHLIYQTAARTFLYTVIDPEGEVLERQTHDYVTARPRLTFDEAGRVTVTGGVRHLMDTDIPPSDPLLSTSAAVAAKAPAK